MGQIGETRRTHHRHNGVLVLFAHLFVQLEMRFQADIRDNTRSSDQNKIRSDQALGVDDSHGIAQRLTLEVVQKVDARSVAPSLLLDVLLDLSVMSRTKQVDLLDLIVDEKFEVVVEESSAA
jgi:hypothetical protein